MAKKKTTIKNPFVNVIETGKNLSMPNKTQVVVKKVEK